LDPPPPFLSFLPRVAAPLLHSLFVFTPISQPASPLLTNVLFALFCFKCNRSNSQERDNRAFSYFLPVLAGFLSPCPAFGASEGQAYPSAIPSPFSSLLRILYALASHLFFPRFLFFCDSLVHRARLLPAPFFSLLGL